MVGAMKEGFEPVEDWEGAFEWGFCIEGVEFKLENEVWSDSLPDSEWEVLELKALVEKFEAELCKEEVEFEAGGELLEIDGGIIWE